jgi:hypothetical protein
MGRLPATFAGRIITARQPWGMAGEVSLTSAQPGIQFPEATFLNSTDRPFEIHRMIPFIVAQDSDGVALTTQPDQDLLEALIRTKINDLGKVTQLLKSATMIRTLVKGSSERTWEFADPYYLVKSEQLQVINDALTFPAIASLVSLKVCMDFQGFFVTLGPPSESR